MYINLAKYLQVPVKVSVRCQLDWIEEGMSNSWRSVLLGSLEGFSGRRTLNQSADKEDPPHPSGWCPLINQLRAQLGEQWTHSLSCPWTAEPQALWPLGSRSHTSSALGSQAWAEGHYSVPDCLACRPIPDGARHPPILKSISRETSFPIHECLLNLGFSFLGFSQLRSPMVRRY